jgi:hypothetical protein
VRGRGREARARRVCVRSEASTNEGEGTVYVQTGGAGCSIHWRAEAESEAAANDAPLHESGATANWLSREYTDSSFCSTTTRDAHPKTQTSS